MTKDPEYSDYGESIYYYSHRVEKEERLIRANNDISERNKEIIFEFCRNRRLKKKFSNARILNLLNRLKIRLMFI